MCKCKSFTLTLDLHAIYTKIDIYMHNTGTYNLKPSKLYWNHKVVRKKNLLYL
jgi:hypothetical protein